MKRLIAPLALILLLPAVSPASDHRNLEEGLPTELQDAYAVAFRNREIQCFVRHTREAPRRHTVEYVPRIELGIAPNAQLSVEGQFLSGSAADKGNGDVAAEVLYNFNTESVWVPATAVAVKGDFPTGENRKGTGVTVKIILTKTPFVRCTLFHRLHANLEWTRKTSGYTDERKERYKGIFGFDVRAWKDTLFVADYIREQKEKKGKDANVVEAGFRVQLTPFTLISVGAGAGIGDDSEDFRIIGGFQHSFTWF